MFPSVGSRIIKRVRPVVGEVQMSADWTPSAATVNVTPAKVTAYDTVIYDTGAGWDNTNKRFVPKTPGYYLVQYAIYTANTTWAANGIGNARVLKNGNSTPVGLSGGVSSSLSISIATTVVQMNGFTDYVELYYFAVNVTTPVFGSTWTSPFRIMQVK